MSKLSCVVLCLLAVTVVASARQHSVGAWTNSCNAPPQICQIIATMSPFGYPNIGGFQSATVNTTTPGQADADLLVSMITTMGMPSAWLGYYSQRAQYDFNLNWANIANSWNINSVVKLSVSAFSSGMAIPRVFEFADKNGNGKFDPDVDSVVSSIDFLAASVLTPIKWSAMTLAQKTVTADNGSPATLYTFNATTLDGVVSLQWSMCDAFYTLPASGALVSPNNTKIDVQVSRYPYKQADTYLALEAVIAGAAMHADDAARIDASGNGVNTTINMGDLGQITWQTLAKADGKDAKVFATGLSKVSWDAVGNTLFAGSLQGQSDVNLQRIFYSFEQKNPKYVYWDPSVGFGLDPVPASGRSLSPWVIAAIVGGVLAALVTVVVFNREKLAATSFVSSRPWLHSCLAPRDTYTAIEDVNARK